MNITELKALAEDLVPLWDNGSFEREDAEQARDAINYLTAQLEDARGEIRALRATDAGLIERVKELGKQLKSIVDADDDHCLSQNHIELARALLEKKE